MLAALHVLEILGRTNEPLSELTAKFTRYVASGEINLRVAGHPERPEAGRGLPHSGRCHRGPLDGLTITLPGGAWFNLRPSNTEPLLRLNIEAPDQRTVDRLREDLVATVSAEE